LADAPQLSQVFQELSLCAVGANDSGDNLVNVLIELVNSGISIEPVDVTAAFMHQDLTVDHGDVSDDSITLPFVLSGSVSSLVSGNLSEITTVSSDLLDVSVESDADDQSGLSGDLLDSYHASGFEPCRFSHSQVVRDLV
jgi:hypothetical protein